MDSATSEQLAERVFKAPDDAKRRTAWQMAGAIGLFALGGVGFLVSIRLPSDPIRLQLMTTLPILIGLAMCASARSRARAPREVAVGPDGIRIECARGTQHLPWADLGWSTLRPLALGKGHCLTLFDNNGTTAATIGDSISELEDLARLIETKINTERPGAAESIQMRKARRASWGIMASGIAFAALGSTLVVTTMNESEDAKLLDSAGVPAVAMVEELKLAPNGVTPRLVYRLKTPAGGSVTHNAEVMRVLWDSLQAGQEVPVIYVPAKPELTRLAFGEVISKRSVVTSYVTSGLMAVLGLLFVVGGVLLRSGREVRFDSKTGRLSIKRYGAR